MVTASALLPQTQLQSLPETRASTRRLGTIWGLLWFNVLAYAPGPTLVHIPSTLGKLLTQGALVVAFILALTVNPRGLVRRNGFLFLFSVLAVTSLMMSVRFVSIGTDYRAIRLVLFVVVLWLLTPWWGRKDLLMLRNQVKVLIVIVGSVVVGAVVAHHKAFALGGRLSGVIWMMPATQVAHYAAELAGLTVLLWLCRMISRRHMLIIVVVSLAVVILTHTRTALIALLSGLLIAGLSLFSTRRRVRRAFAALVIVGVVAWGFSPLITTWLARGGSSTTLNDLSGRTKVWTQLIATQRPEPNVILGSGLSNDSFGGLPIDSSWLAVYEEQGLVGDVLVGAAILLLLLTSLLRPRGPARAAALFLIVYSLVASFFETGLGSAATYSLDLAMAACLLATPAATTFSDSLAAL